MEEEANIELEETPAFVAPKTSLVSKILSGIFNLYILIALVIFTPYYNWQYAKDNGFVSWLLLGEIVPTAKAAVWPYFVFFNKSNDVSWTQEEKEGSNHLLASLQASMKGLDVIRNINVYARTQADLDQILAFNKTALAEAQLVSDSVLDKTHPELRSHFKDEYVEHLKLIIQVLQSPKGNETTEARANELLGKWGAWFDKHRKEFKRPKD